MAWLEKEIADYVTGVGLSLFEKDSKVKAKKSSQGFKLADAGWDKRIKDGMQVFIRNATKEDLKNIGLKEPTTSLIVGNKEKILQRSLTDGVWGGVNKLGDSSWKKMALHVKEAQTSKIDTVVTTDIHRLIRMNGTLHGKTGLKKIEFPAKHLHDFDPFTEAVVFKKGKAKVLVSDAPEFRLGGETLGPYKNETVDLPVAAAVMLICKGRAEVTN